MFIPMLDESYQTSLDFSSFESVKTIFDLIKGDRGELRLEFTSREEIVYCLDIFSVATIATQDFGLLENQSGGVDSSFELTHTYHYDPTKFGHRFKRLSRGDAESGEIDD